LIKKNYLAIFIRELTFDKEKLFRHIYDLGSNVNPFSPSLVWFPATYHLYCRVHANSDIPTALGVGQDITKEEIERVLDTIGEADKKEYKDQYEVVTRKLSKEYIIYKNARDAGKGILNDVFVQTSMTLGSTLENSVIQSGGSELIRETGYVLVQSPNNQYYLQESEKELSSISSEIQNQHITRKTKMLINEVMLGKKDVTWPYHIWYNTSLLHLLEDAGRPYANSSPRFGSLSVGNLLAPYKDSNNDLKFDSQCMSNLVNTCSYGDLTLFEKANIICLFLSDCTRETMVGMYHEDACPPITYLMLRPYMEYATMPIIFLSQNAAIRVRGNPSFRLGTGTVTGIVRARYSQSSGTLIAIKEDVYNQNSAMVVDSIGGSGAEFYDPVKYIDSSDDYFNPDTGYYGPKGELSIFAVEVPIGTSRRLGPYLDITGHYQKIIAHHSDSRHRLINCPPSYPCAYRFCNFWRINKYDVSRKHTIIEPPNTMCCAGKTWYSNNRGEYVLSTTSKTYWGDIATFPGVKSYRNGSKPTPSENVF